MRFSSRNTLANYTVLIAPLSELAGCQKNQSTINCDSLNISLESISIPDTYYNVPDTVLLDFVGATYTGNFPIAQGQYTVDELLTAMTTFMTALDTPTYTYSQNPTNKAWIITSSAATTYSLTFPAPLINYIQSANSGNGGTVISEASSPDIMDLGLMDMTRTRNFYIYCSQHPNMSYLASPLEYDGILATTNLTARLLAIIPIGSNEQYIGRYFQRSRAGIVSNRWQIELRDDYDQPIYCNGFEWTLNIFFQLVPECNTNF